MASKRLRAVNANEGEGLAVDMSPMIDMVFLLLIFFLVNASLVIVKMDKRVQVPIAENSTPQEKKIGRIVVNVYGDEMEGTRFRDEEGVTPFADDAAILQYITDAKDKMAGSVTPQLHLRADRNTDFKHARRVIQIAAEAGVNQVIFASYASPNQYR